MSLLLDALKKAAEDKEQTGSKYSSRPAAARTGGSADDGSQLMELLQGQQSDFADTITDAGGFEPLPDQSELSRLASPALSLSLIDDDEPDYQDKKGMPGAATIPAVNFEFQDEEAVDADSESVSSESKPAPLSSLTLLDDDDIDETLSNIQAAADASQIQEEAPPKLQFDIDREGEQPVAENLLQSAPSVEVRAEEPLQVDANTDVAEQASLTLPETVAVEGVEPVEAPDPISEPVSASTLAPEVPLMPESVLASEPVPVAEPEPVPEPAHKPVPVPEPQPAPGVASVPPALNETGRTEGADMGGMAAAPPEGAAGGGSGAFVTAPDLVLDALKRRKRRRRVLVLALIMAVGMTAGGWGYLMFQEEMAKNNRTMAGYRLRMNPAPQPAPSPEQSETAAVAPVATNVTTKRGGVTTPEPEVSVVKPVSPQVTEVTEPVVAPVAKPEQQTPATAVATAINRDREQKVAGRIDPVTTAETTDGTYLKKDSEPLAGIATSSEIKVSRRTVDQGILDQKLDIARRSTEARVMRAYRAFKEKDYPTALRLYQQALKEEPFSRDAVMGLAALAAVDRDFNKAAYYYNQLLDYDPTDRAAFEGLIGLPETGLDLVEMESRLRSYLAEKPDSMRAQARLGRTLARQQRWQEAQQAFFNAYRLNPEDPSYALNVAIALDHLRKFGAARQYYERVLTLETRAGPISNIDLMPIRQRLDALSRLEN